MAAYIRQIECVQCSHTGTLIHHSAEGQRPVDQSEALTLGKRAVLTCGRCGSSSLLITWGEAFPAATSGIVSRRKVQNVPALPQ